MNLCVALGAERAVYVWRNDTHIHIHMLRNLNRVYAIMSERITSKSEYMTG
jgi:hypothetical protein